MAKHLIDTDLYIDLIQSGTTLPIIRELYEKETPGIYFSSIVVQELLAGARSPSGRRRVEVLFRPFERAGRIVTPQPQALELTRVEFWLRSCNSARSEEQIAFPGKRLFACAKRAVTWCDPLYRKPRRLRGASEHPVLLFSRDHLSRSDEPCHVFKLHSFLFSIPKACK